MNAAPPPGFVPLDDWGGRFIAHNGPVFRREDPDGLVIGFRAMPHHSNDVTVHGGWMAGFMDLLLPLAGMHQAGLLGHAMLTISMTLDYLGPVPIGAWVEGRGQALRRTRKLLFCSAIATVDGEPLVRGSGVWKIGKPIADHR